MKRKGLLIIVLLGAILAVSTVHAETFQITIENLSSNVLTPVVFVAHDASADLFDEGAAASADLEALAEDGITTGIETLVSGLAAVSDYAITAGGPITPGGSRTITLETTDANPWLSYLSMLAVSNDAFIGATTGDGAIDLFPGGIPLNGVFTVSSNDVWDAGTEVNDELDENVPALGGAGSVDQNGVISRPHPGIQGIGDISLDSNWVGGDVARITIVPEPATLALMAMGGAVLLRRRRKV